MTLADLGRILDVFPAGSTFARALGVAPQAVPQRVKRGSPELTEAESETLRAVLDRAGLSVKTGDDVSAAA